MYQDARNELAELREQLEQLRREGVRSAAMAGEIIAAFGETFRREQRAAARDGENGGAAVMLNKSVTVPLGVKEQRLVLPASGGARKVLATALCSDSSQIVVVRLQCTDGAEPLPRMAGEPEPSGEHVVRLPAGETKVLLESGARTAPLEVSLCRVGGEPCVVRLQLDDEAGAAKRVDTDAARERTDGARAVKGTLWKAQELLREGRAERAMEVALAYATDIERPALALLRATLAKDDASWLANVNAYVEPFGIAPIGLRDGPEPRFMRLTADAPRAVTGGPLVTVIMPAFNAEKTLELAASSILKQSWTELELIIVDDCSSDGTFDIAQRITRLDPRVKVLRNKVNVGPYVSKNIALSTARGAYITCHDADDWAHPQRIENQVAAVKTKGARACVASWLRLDEEGAFCGFTAVGRHSHDGALRLAHVSCLVETEFMRRHVGYWDSVRFGADGELLERLERILGDALLRPRQLAALSLDRPQSLTNDAAYGVSNGRGLSAPRRAYRDAWRRWHATLTFEQSYLSFPQSGRPFAAPEECVVPSASMMVVIASAAASRS